MVKQNKKRIPKQTSKERYNKHKMDTCSEYFTEIPHSMQSNGYLTNFSQPGPSNVCVTNLVHSVSRLMNFSNEYMPLLQNPGFTQLHLIKYLPCFDRNKYRIVFFTTDLEIATEYESFTTLIQTCRKLGHEVTVVTNSCDVSIIKNELRSIHVQQIGRQSLRNQNGELHNHTHVMRTAYTALWLINKEALLRPTFVVVRNANSAVSLLKILGNMRIVYFQTLNDLRLLASSDPQYDKYRNHHKYAMINSSEIILSNLMSVNEIRKVIGRVDIKSSVLYPCYNVIEFIKSPVLELSDIVNLPNDAVYFVTFGPLRKQSMFELVIHAFALLLEKAHECDPYLYENLYLIVVCYVEDTEKYKEYVTYLTITANIVCFQRQCVIFVHGSPVHYRKTLISHCEAVLHPMIFSDGRIIVEAACMRKPVIATDFGLAKELIIHEETGFLLKPVAEDFFKCMFMVTYYRAGIEERSKKIARHYNTYFSELRYIAAVQRMITRNAYHNI